MHTSKILLSKKSPSVPVSVRPSITSCPVLSHPVTKKSHWNKNITTQSCRINFKDKRNTLKVKLPPLQMLGKAKLTNVLRYASFHTSQLCVLIFKTTCFHHLPRVGLKQLYALAHLKSTREAGTF